MSESVLSLLRRGASKEASNEPLIIVGNGDLQQMSAQANFLKERGFDVRFQNVYPAMPSENDARLALAAMWNQKVDGWWNLRHLFQQYETCTELEFSKALGGGAA